MKNLDHLILGHGFTADYLKSLIKEKEPGCEVYSTSRCDPSRLKFDLSDSATWHNLPKAKITYWTFPPEPFFLVQEFYEKMHQQLGRLVVVGSTSSFLTNRPDETVDERSPLNLKKERVQSEVFLQNQGATLVMSAGIYGSGRNPLDWVKKSMVGKSDKYVNMIHVEDLAQFLYLAGQNGKSGQLYLASDGRPVRWREAIESWEAQGLLSDTPEKGSQRSSKKVDRRWWIKCLGVQIRHPNFVKAASQIGPS